MSPPTGTPPPRLHTLPALELCRHTFYVQCQVRLQAQAKGNALIGRELYPLLTAAQYEHVHVSPRMVYVDESRPELVSGFTKNTFTAMIQGVKQPSIAAGLMTEIDFDRGITDLFRTAEPDGVLSYTFFKATAAKIQ
jgi:hypothetical protein